MANSKVIGVDLGGNIEAKLDAMASGVAKNVELMEQLHGSMSKVEHGLKDIGKSEQAQVLMEAADKFAEVAEKVEGAAHRMIEVTHEAMTEIVKDASMFEDAQSSMQFAFGEGWKQKYDALLKESQHLTFKFSEVLNLATQMGRMHVDPFGGATKSAQEFKAKTGEMIGAFDVIQDVVSGTGAEVTRVMGGLRHAMAGNFMEFQRGLAMPHELIAKMKTETKAATTEQEKYNILIKELAGFYGGAGKLKQDNMSMQLLQVADVMEQLKGLVGGGAGLKELSQGVHSFYDAIKSLLEDKDKVAALAAGFAVLEGAVAQVIRWVSAVVTWGGELIKMAPWLPKVAAYVWLVVIAGTVFIATAMGMAAAIIGIGIAISAVGLPMLGVVLLLTALIIPAMLLAIATAGILGVAVSAMFGRATESGDDTVGMLEKLSALFIGLEELIGSYNGSTGKMSLETADRLKKAGMFEYALKLFQLFDRIHTAWESFSEAISEASDVLGPIIDLLFGEMRDGLNELVEALGLSGDKLNESSGDAEDWVTTGRELAIVVLALAKAFITMGVGAIRIARAVADAWDYVEVYLFAVGTTAKMIYNPLGALADIIDRIRGKGTESKKSGFLADLERDLKRADDLANDRRKEKRMQWDLGLMDPEQRKQYYKEQGGAPWKPGDLSPEGTLDPAAASDDFNTRRRARNKRMQTPGGAPLGEGDTIETRSQVPFVEPVTSVVPAERPSAGIGTGVGMETQQTSGKLDAQTAILSQIASILANQKLEVTLDGATIAKSVHGAGDTTGGIQ